MRSRRRLAIAAVARIGARLELDVHFAMQPMAIAGRVGEKIALKATIIRSSVCKNAKQQKIVSLLTVI